jgi:hypothetical protein
LLHEPADKAGVFVRIAPLLQTAAPTLSSEALFQYAPEFALVGVPIDCHVCALSGETTATVASATPKEIRRIR